VFHFNKKNLSTGLFTLAISSFFSALYFSFQAGCAGDVKTGAFGNSSLALEIENSAFYFMFFGLVLGALATTLRTSAVAQRFANVLGFVVIWFILFWLVSSHIEALGVQSCFKA
jgi:hypothetical protein